MDPRYDVFDGVQIPQVERQFWGLSAPLKAFGVFAAVYAKMAERIEISFGGLTHVGRRNHVLLLLLGD